MGGEATPGQRPKRADARRNYDALVAAARDAFRTKGSDATLDEIARAAGVGIGTLYRHFPTRLVLAEVVYREAVDELAVVTKELVRDLPAWDALTAWVDEWTDVALSKRVIFAELADAVSKDSDTVSYCRNILHQCVDLVLSNAQEAGVARADIDTTDLLQLIGGVLRAPNVGTDQARRLQRVVLDGIKN
ncbi:TetR/AcrR family transcriptional regulator [Nocardioidaceae bacterium SCSIO 66511]|nr:TetR/AcrR family transcriptional regulator [Nocardioidaceae bacterium SCSIO 66511]